MMENPGGSSRPPGFNVARTLSAETTSLTWRSGALHPDGQGREGFLFPQAEGAVSAVTGRGYCGR